MFHLTLHLQFFFFFFFFNDTATTEIYTLSLHDALPIYYLRAQVEAGAQALQVFDSWIGALDEADYREFALPHLKRIFDGLHGLGVPLIHFGTGTGHLLAVQREAGGSVIGIDWRTPRDGGWRRAGEGVAGQGNLDPPLLFAPREGRPPRGHAGSRSARGRFR